MAHTRRLLVCVTGLTPQVVTETVYALALGKDPWIPTEVHVLTTVTGAALVRDTLLSHGAGHFLQLCADYSLEGIAFDDSFVHVLRDADGLPLDDIRTPADNMAIADAIVTRIAELSREESTELHVSLAGGRKSMGFFAGYALSLYGREHDRLSHVLVSQGFESNPEFFFPPRTARTMRARDGSELSTADARIELADIPFVRLRERLPEGLLGGGGFAEAVEAAQRKEAPRLVVRKEDRTVNCGGTAIRLSPVNFATYAWHADRARRMVTPEVILSAFDATRSISRMELQEYGRRLYENAMSSEAEKWNEGPWGDDDGTPSQWLAERRTRINREIRRELGKRGVGVYGIASERIAGRASQHRLKLPSDAIEFTE